MPYNVVVNTSEPHLARIPSVFEVPPRIGERITLIHQGDHLSGNVESIEHLQQASGAFETNVYLALD